MIFVQKTPNAHGWVNPRDVEELFLDYFVYFYKEYDNFEFPLTIYQDVVGRP